MPREKRYDVFLSHNSADKPAVEYLAQRLRQEGLEPFLDKWHLVPGDPWQEALEEALDQSRTCAVFLGPEGLGPWENEEMRVALNQRVRDPDFRVIPVLLPNAQMPERGRLPPFLARLTWVDFRAGLDDADAFHRLVCGIKGVAPGPAGGEVAPPERERVGRATRRPKWLWLPFGTRRALKLYRDSLRGQFEKLYIFGTVSNLLDTYTSLKLVEDPEVAFGSMLSTAKRSDIEEVLLDRKVVILGEPGSGKTTLMKYLALRLVSVWKPMFKP